MAEQHDYDIIILGGGSAGIVSGVMAGALKMRVLLIEKGKMGGECLNTGCVPSKALLHAAKVARTVRTAGQVGLRSHPVGREEAAGVLAHVRATVRVVEQADATAQLLRDNGVEIRFGDASFRDPHTLVLGGDVLTSDSFILATGSRPVAPEIPGLGDGEYLTNHTVFALEAVPESLLVVGGGPIGVEMAQAFQWLGSRVTLVQKGDRLLPHDDSEMARRLEGYLRDDGMDVRLNTTLTEVRRTGDVRTGLLTSGGETAEVPFEHVLFGIGRRPNTEGLNLEAAGVDYDDHAVTVDASLRTTAPHIYACGDLLGHDQFSHLAEYEAKTVVRNIVFPGESKASFRLEPWATFTEPELAHVGRTEDELKAQGVPYEVYRQPFSQNDRALTDNEPRGLVKVLTQGLTGKILGVHILGSRAGELAQEWILAMEHGHTIRDIADLIHIYPTLSMASQHAAQHWYERQSQRPLAQTALSAYTHVVRPRQTGIAWGALAAALAGAWLADRRGGARRDDPGPPPDRRRK